MAIVVTRSWLPAEAIMYTPQFENPQNIELECRFGAPAFTSGESSTISLPDGTTLHGKLFPLPENADESWRGAHIIANMPDGVQAWFVPDDPGLAAIFVTRVKAEL